VSKRKVERHVATAVTDEWHSAETIPPTGQDIERFISAIVHRLKSVNRDMPLSLSTMKVGLSAVIKTSQFHHSSFRLGSHEAARIDSLLESLVLQNVLTREMKRERAWLGANIMTKIVHHYIQDCLDNGCLDWDISLVKLQNMVLVTALACRVGDVTKGARDRHKLPYLVYGDIDIKLVRGGTTIDDLNMMVTLRNEKANK
jgi:hypothetical protein